MIIPDCFIEAIAVPVHDTENSPRGAMFYVSKGDTLPLSALSDINELTYRRKLSVCVKHLLYIYNYT